MTNINKSKRNDNIFTQSKNCQKIRRVDMKASIRKTPRKETDRNAKEFSPDFEG
ncbi:hypothetical protein [Candidatus Nitrotoga arctica]|uniref:Uncharacterized protein n=1 Tax=Candidatus Nitrotoga arctica TaxID=453162 RepID=A0ABN8ALG5_9PROT|nr:hypothetical protein [Candidatus Nitrotoga arctica]CAG9933628.1 protein of unknown function [Candidatus Nitrotoga arctica]